MEADTVADLPAEAKAGESAEGRPLISRKRLIQLGAAIAAIAAATWLLPTRDWLRAALDWISGLGPWGGAVFVAIYVLLSVVALPTSLLNIGAGILFGVIEGFALSLAAATISNCVCFFVSRYIARDWIERRLEARPKYAALLHGLDGQSWRIILLTRLNPLLPSAVAGYAFGATPVRFHIYLLASIVGNAPLCLLMAWAGAIGGRAFSQRHDADWLDYTLWTLGIASTIAITIWITRYTGRKLKAIQQPANDHADA